MARRVILWTAGVLSFFILTGRAQVTTGTISGTVVDSTRAVLPGVQVLVVNQDTGISRTVQTGSAGRYAVPNLGLGSYQVTATLPGFQTAVRSGIVLTVGREAIVDFELAVGAVTQGVEVSGEAPLVESTTSSLGSLVDDRTIRELPLNGRSYDQLALLQPGVVAMGGGTGQNFSYGAGTRFSVGGGRGDTNSFLLDGTDINDQANSTPGGAGGTNLGVDTIREFKILTNSFSAEYGRSSGAVISAVTMSGTNTFHGNVFEFLRNSAMDARNFFDGSRVPPFKRNQFGGDLGGPIRRDKTFFYGGYEGLRQGLGQTTIAFVPTVLAKRGILPVGGPVTVNQLVKPFLALWPDPNGRDFGDGTSEYISAPQIITNENYFMVRVDHQLNQKTSIFGRYSFDNDSVFTPTSLPNFAATTSGRRQYSTLQANTAFNSTLLNNFRFAFNRSFQADDLLPTVSLPDSLSFIPGQPVGVMQVGAVNGVFAQRTVTSLGTSNTVPRLWGYNVFEWGDTLSKIKGRHSLKFGLGAERLRDNTAQNTQLRGQYTFATFNDLLAAKPSNFQAVQVGENAYRGFRQTMWSAFGQDDFKVSPRLVLNLGLRWEAVTDPTEVNGMVSNILTPLDPSLRLLDRFFHIGKKNFAPRVGLAWQLNSSGTRVLRVGGGIFYNEILPMIYALQVAKLPPFYTLLSANSPIFPNGYTQLGGAKPRLITVASTVKTPVKDQYNVSVQQQVGRNTVLEIAYVGSKANHLARFSEKNPAVSRIQSDGSKFFPDRSPRRNPNFDSIRMITTDTNAYYNALQVTVKRRSAAGLQYQAFYTFSKSMDEISGIATGDTTRDLSTSLDPDNPARDWGRSVFDATHNFVFTLSYPLPFRINEKAAAFFLGRWTLNGIGTFRSGQPLTPRLSFNNSRDLDNNNADRPSLKPGASPNPVRGGPDQYFDPSVFFLPPAGTFGNLGRNTVIGPGFGDVDLSVEKDFPFWREGTRVRFRAEMFNVLNHANFGLPSPVVLTPTGISRSAGRITNTVTSSRQVQLALKFIF